MKRSSEWSRGFSAGVLSALYVLHYAGQDTYYDEVIEACGAEDVILEARRSGNMANSGIREYVKRRRARKRAEERLAPRAPGGGVLAGNTGNHRS